MSQEKKISSPFSEGLTKKNKTPDYSLYFAILILAVDFVLIIVILVLS